MFKTIKSFVATAAAPFLREDATPESHYPFIMPKSDVIKFSHESYVSGALVNVCYEVYIDDKLRMVNQVGQAVKTIQGGEWMNYEFEGQRVTLSTEQILRVDLV